MSKLAGEKVFVTGATGFLGGALVKRLSEAGAQVRALERRPNRDGYIRDLENVEIVRGDIQDLHLMRQLMRGSHYIFHVAAATSGRMSFQQQVNVEGTRHVALAAANENVRRLIHVSSIAVYGYRYRYVVNENTPHFPGNVPYNVTKAQAEDVLLRVANKHHLSFSIIRPGMIYGPRSGMWTEKMYQLAKLRPMPFIGDGRGSAYPIYVDDVVDLMLLQATHPAAHDQAFNCVMQPQPTWREYLGGYMAMAGHQRWLTLPQAAVHASAPLVDFLLALGSGSQDVGDLVSLVNSPVVYAMDKARRLLGWEPKMSLEEGFAHSAAYLIEQGLL